MSERQDLHLIAAGGGILGGVVAFGVWCFVISRQLKRALPTARGFGE